MDLNNVSEQRMYHLTTFYLAGIHAGIQSYHAGMEYALKFWETPEFQRWAKIDKTVIVLAGGDTNDMGTNYHSNEAYFGGMQGALKELYVNDIPYASFFEPGVNNALTSIAFLAGAEVWDKESYPDAPYFIVKELENVKDIETVRARKQLEANTKEYGPKAAFLRVFLKQFYLAK